MNKSINTWHWLEKEETESTNDDAISFSKTAKEKFVITALKQTKGRGRFNRSWESLDGNLFMSLGLEYELNRLGNLVLLSGLSLLEAISSLSPFEVELKWPNDVLLNGKKVSGILLEKGAGNFIVIGIGVNIKTSPKIDGLLYPATSLEEEGARTTRLDFLENYLECFNKNLLLTPQTLHSRWLAHAKGLNQKLQIGDKEGIFKGLDDNGLMLLEINGIETKIYNGDVFYKE